MSNVTPRPPISPVVWQPPANPGLVGDHAPNMRLAAAAAWLVPGHGPEDVVVAADGTVYTGTNDGAILALTDDGTRLRRVAMTGGRPLGIELLGDDRLLVADATLGLLAVSLDDGAIEPLVTEIDGVPLRLTNNATVQEDGTIWFTNSSDNFPLEHYTGDIIEHAGTGRLFRRDPDGRVETVLTGLHFANGVTVTSSGEAVLVAETGMFRILRHHLSGPDAGETDVFATVPGFPDNLSTGPSGTIWCAVASGRNPLAERLAPLPPVLRKAVWALPAKLRPGPDQAAYVFGFDDSGAVTQNLQSQGGEFHMATGVREHDGRLFVGSLHGDRILCLDLNA